MNDNISPVNQEEWQKAAPEELPEPTYWPFYLAMGIMFLAWGLLTMWEFSFTGNYYHDYCIGRLDKCFET